MMDIIKVYGSAAMIGGAIGLSSGLYAVITGMIFCCLLFGLLHELTKNVDEGGE